VETRQDDTIAAISTPLGEGGIAVIRLSGPEAMSIVRKVFRSHRKILQAESRRAYQGWIMDGEEPVDEVVLTYFRAPHSYTGEDVVEVSCHGGRFVSQRILELVMDQGARLSAPGEFTQRGFLHNKMDLSQAEAVADLIQARTEASRRVAAYQLQGQLSLRLKDMRDHLINACSLLEIELDFSEEDVTFASRKELMRMLRSIKKEMQDLLSTFDRGRVCREGIRMVISGRPNVGKSSVLNALLERERAIVTEIPGTTRDTIEEMLDIGGLLFVITDTAGICKTDDPIERESVRRAEEAIETADFVLVVIDGSRPLTRDDEMLIEKVKKSTKRALYVINKNDLGQRVEIQTLKERVPDAGLVHVSALKKKGFSKLLQKLEETVLADGIPHTGEAVLTRLRHWESLNRAMKHVRRAILSIRKEMSQEFIVLDLRGAMDALGEITGQTTAEDVLKHIFSEFCIGK